MATSATVTMDGTTGVVSIPFPYLEKTHVLVEQDGVLLEPTDYAWITAGSIEISPTPANGTKVRVYRRTPEAPLTIYQSGSVLTRDQLETDSLQALYRVEELHEIQLRTLRVADGSTADTELPEPALGLRPIGWNADLSALVYLPSSEAGETVDVTEFGAVGDGVTDCSAAVAAAYDYAVSAGVGIRYPEGDFRHNSKIVMTTPVAIIGAGLGQTTLRAPFNGPLFEFDNPAKAAMKLWGGFRFIGAGSPTVNTASCCFYFPPTSIGITHCTFRDITTNSAHAFMISDATPADNGAAIAMRFSGQINWCTFDNISFRINVKYGFLWNQGSGTGNAWQGGKPAIDVSGGAFIEINGPAAPENLNLGVNVGDIIINNVHALTEGAADRATCAFFRGGPNTNYRSRILLNGCQFDARADYPLDLSATGSLDWSNVVVNGNVLGGEADVASKVPPLARSSVTDQGASEWKSQYNASNSSTTLVAQQAFLISLGIDTGCQFRVVVSGGWPGYGTGIGSWEFLARRGSAGPTVYAGPSNVGAHVDIGLNVTAVASGNDILVSVENKTASGSASWDAQLVATGGALKVQNKRHF